MSVTPAIDNAALDAGAAAVISRIVPRVLVWFSLVNKQLENEFKEGRRVTVWSFPEFDFPAL